MRILILGGNGMIGHKMYQMISKVHMDTWVTLRNDITTYIYSNIYNNEKVIGNIDLSDFKKLLHTLNEIKPDIILNACGITIRRGVEEVKSNTILINSVLPHILNEWVSLNNKRLIHFSTDCVFSGKKGDYLDTDIKDAYDLYGSTKSLGEIVDSKFAITLRGSMIGRELENKTELFEWFLQQSNNKIKGFSEVIYAGITTVKMAEIVLRLINFYPNLSGIYNISSKPISKYDLLKMCNEHFEINSIIEMDNSYKSNKNLISDKFFIEIGIEKPNWIDLIRQLKDDSLIYTNLYN
jgi:dTDP-4-dehydrorhamnose reductase